MQLRLVVSIGVLIGQIFNLGMVLSPAVSAGSSGVVISQMQTAGLASSSDEFIELSNPTSADISLAGWQMQYRSSSTTNGTDCTKGWTTKATVGPASIAAGGHYLFAPTIYLAADTSFSAGLAQAGTVRLLDQTKGVVDALAWGAASCGSGHPASAAQAGQSLERREGLDGSHGDNATDFFIQASPAPQASTATFKLAPTVSPTPSPTASPSGATLAATDLAPNLEITELLVDPVAPKTDATDEFVEIHNAGTATASVGGYVVKTGTHAYTLPTGTIAPDGYMVITSGQTNISLTNSGGVANLIDPAGTVIDTAGAWESAVPGASWAYIDGTWLWTLTPTPGAANVYTPVPGTAGADDSIDYPVVELSELLPDPASPLTDAADEFIEIHNPNSQAVDLEGYVLKVGHDLSKKYVIKGLVVPGGGYIVLKSSVTKLALVNDGSSVALYTPNGLQLGSTVTYAKAGAGYSWAHFEDGWDWTSEPTPGGANVLAAISAAVTSKATASKTVKAKAAAKPRVAAKAKTSAKAKNSKASTKPLVAATTTTGGRWLLFLLGGLTIAYIIYEFRNDIRNYYYKLRGYPVGRLAPIPVAEGRGSDRADKRPRRG